MDLGIAASAAGTPALETKSLLQTPDSGYGSLTGGGGGSSAGGVPSTLQSRPVSTTPSAAAAAARALRDRERVHAPQCPMSLPAAVQMVFMPPPGGE